MKVLFFTVGDLQIASSRTRIYEFIPYFESRGVETKIIPFVRYTNGEHLLPLTGLVYSTRLSRILSAVKEASRYDLVVVQRLMIPYPFLALLKKRNPNLVLDMDDAIYTNKVWVRLSSFDRSLRCYKIVIISNEFLRRQLESKVNGILHLPTCINTNYFKPVRGGREDAKVKIGWIGTSHTEKYLSLIEECLKRLTREFSHVQFHIISSGHRVLNDLPVVIKKWTLNRELTDLSELDIGIMPLADGYWERAKSGYKILQYLALGIPVVASGVGINAQLIQQGQTGFVANTQEEWFRYLSLLIQDVDLRQSMGQKGREWVVQNYDHEVYFPKFYEALTSLLEDGNQ